MANSSLSLESRVLGCWQGKSVGGTLGLPAEGRTDRQSFTFYDPVPTIVPPNDDLELQLVWLHLMENHRGALTIEAIAAAWQKHMHYMWDEYGRATWNLRRGVPPALCGVFENPFASGMGSPIRSEIWAIVAGGNPDLAEQFARLDSMIDHGVEGAAGEIFFAVLQTLILNGAALPEAIEEGLRRVQPNTETRQALDLIGSLHGRGVECWQAREELLRRHHHDNFTHAPLNVALTLWALLYGEGDFSATILLGVNGGYDTDCTAATAGATLGLLYGDTGLPEKWVAPLGDSVTIGPGIIGIDAPTTLHDLTKRSMALVHRATELAPVFPGAPRVPQLSALPGTVDIANSLAVVPFANGELPPEIKAGGGGTLLWKRGESIGAFRLIALARGGCRLWVDGRKIIDCPAGLPYVPATHRSHSEACATFLPTADSHEVRLELNSGNPWQEATLLLVDESMHLAPWNGVQLPHASTLPSSL